MQDFATQVLTWFDQHGRKDLPWQQETTAYSIWVSEIMLQQTQVTTVIPYYQRFIARFPTVQALAEAPLDTVLHYWTGLGYYARARHLHQAAHRLQQHYGGQMPTTLEELMALPGIGRSTAGAILALAYQQRQPILDGNVKRVLCRYHALAGWPNATPVNAQLWALADTHTPSTRVADYTQAMMDLGATVCRRSQPLCERCPLQTGCQAYQHNSVAQYPTPRPRKAVPQKSITFLMLTHSQRYVVLQQRPSNGIWGGLWCFPELDTPEAAATWCAEQAPCQIISKATWPTMLHILTHFQLQITPVWVTLSQDTTLPPLPPAHCWYDLQQPAPLGLAVPVVKLLRQLTASS